MFTRFGGNVAHRPRKTPLDFGCNPFHVTLGLGLGLRVGGDAVILRTRGHVSYRVFNVNSFVTSAALVEACGLLSVILG